MEKILREAQDDNRNSPIERLLPFGCNLSLYNYCNLSNFPTQSTN